MTSQKIITPQGWKKEFSEGEIIAIKGIGMVVVKITKRGLALRRVKQTQPNHP